MILHPSKTKEQKLTSILQITSLLLKEKRMKLQYWQNSGKFLWIVTLRYRPYGPAGCCSSEQLSSSSKLCSQFPTLVLNWKNFISNSGPVYLTIKTDDLQEPANRVMHFKRAKALPRGGTFTSFKLTSNLVRKKSCGKQTSSMYFNLKIQMSRVTRFKDRLDKLYQFFDKVSNPNQYEMTFLKKKFMSTREKSFISLKTL